MLSIINHYFLKFEFNGLVWIYRYAPSNFRIRRVRPAFYCSLDPDAFSASAGKGASYTTGTHLFCRCVLNQRLWWLVNGEKTLSTCGGRTSQEDWLTETRHIRDAQGLRGTWPQSSSGQCFPLDGESGLRTVAWGRSQQNSLSTFISYHTPNVQHWTQFCCLNVRNINCLKKQYTNYLKLKICIHHCPFVVYKRPNLQCQLTELKGKKKLSAHYKTHQVQRRQININVLHKTHCSNYANK